MESSSCWLWTMVLLWCSLPGSNGEYDVRDVKSHKYLVKVYVAKDRANLLIAMGVLVKSKWVLTACHVLVSLKESGDLELISPQLFTIELGFLSGSSESRPISYSGCVKPLNEYIHLGDNMGILIVETEDLPSHTVEGFDVRAFMRERQIAELSRSNTCEVLSWSAKRFRRKSEENSPGTISTSGYAVKKLNSNACAIFLSAEIAPISSHLNNGSLLCFLPVNWKTEEYIEFLPGTPVFCSNLMLGVVSVFKEPALIEVFPIVVTVVTRSLMQRETHNSDTALVDHSSWSLLAMNVILTALPCNLYK